MPANKASQIRAVNIKQTVTVCVFYVKAIYSYINKNPIYLLAAGIAFNVLMCIVPVILCFLYILGLWFERGTAFSAFAIQLQTFIPDQSYRNAILNTLHQQIDIIIRTKKLAGSIGIIGTFWTGSVLFSSARTALNHIYNFPSHRSFLFLIMKDILMVFLFGVLVIIASFITPLSSIALHYGSLLLPKVVYNFVSGIFPILFSIATSFVLFYLLYRFLAHRSIPSNSALIGAMISTILWECAKMVFTVYLSRFATFGIVYGTYAFIVVSAVWIYYSSLVFILGGVVTRVHWERRQFLNPEGI